MAKVWGFFFPANCLFVLCLCLMQNLKNWFMLTSSKGPALMSSTCKHGYTLIFNLNLMNSTSEMKNKLVQCSCAAFWFDRVLLNIK